MATLDHTPAVQADDQRTMDDHDYLRQLLAAPDLTPREVLVLERLDAALEHIAYLEHEVQQYERRGCARMC